MGFRLTEEEAFTLGLRKDEKGNWHPKGNTVAREPGRVLAKSVRLDDSRSLPDPERDAGRDVSAPARNKKVHEDSGTGSDKFRIVVTVFSSRHQDPDNLYPKHFIDLLVRAGILPDDSSKYVEGIEKKVCKVESKSQEKTVIEVFRKCNNR